MAKDGFIQVPVAPRTTLLSQNEIWVVAKHAGAWLSSITSQVICGDVYGVRATLQPPWLAVGVITEPGRHLRRAMGLDDATDLQVTENRVNSLRSLREAQPTGDILRHSKPAVEQKDISLSYLLVSQMSGSRPDLTQTRSPVRFACPRSAHEIGVKMCSLAVDLRSSIEIQKNIGVRAPIRQAEFRVADSI